MKFIELLKSLPKNQLIDVYVFDSVEIENVAYCEARALISNARYSQFDVLFTKDVPNINYDLFDNDTYIYVMLDNPNSRENKLLKAVEEVLKNAN